MFTFILSISESYLREKSYWSGPDPVLERMEDGEQWYRSQQSRIDVTLS